MSLDTHEVLDHLGVPVVLASADDTSILFANPAARDLLGLADDAVRSTPLLDVFLEPEPFEDCLARLARAEPGVRADTLVRRPDGTVLPVTVSVGAAFQDGRAALVVSFHDLSALRRSERRLRLRAELEELLSDISIRLLSVAGEEVDAALRDVLREVGQVALAESAVVALWSGDQLAGIESWENDPKTPSAWRVLLESDPDTMRRILQDRQHAEIVTSRFDDLPPGVPDSFSLLLVPIRGERKLHGLLGIEASSPDRSWRRVERTLETVARIFANVLGRREAEALARRNEELLSGISRNVSDAVYRAEVEGDVIYLNPAFARMFGFSSVTELLSHTGAEIYDDPDVRNQLRRELLAEGAIRNREVRFRRADGTTFWGLLSTVLVRDEAEIPRFFDGAISDIDDRKRAEEALVAERELLAVTLASIGDGVFAIDADGRIALANERAGVLTGRSEHRMVGQPIDQVLELREPGGAEEPGPRVEIGPLLAQGSRIRHREAVLEVAGAAGERLQVEWNLSPWRLQGEHASGWVVVITDLTERRRTEAERLKANKLEAVGLLAGGIAHDFRNILSVIQGNASLASRFHDRPEVLPELFSEIVTAANRAGDLTEQLLTFSRGGAPIKSRVDPAHLVEEAVNLARRGSRAAYRVELDTPLPAIEADRGQIHQVLSNLLINAQQAMPGGGVITVEGSVADGKEVSAVGLQGRFAAIVVRDEGPGIAEGDLPRIFDPYFTTKQGGTGLGLASAYSIVKRHGGRITVSSPRGAGARFTIFLPLAPPADPTPPAPIEVAPQAAVGSARVLVVDDESALRRSAARMLRALGYRCETAEEGEAAIAAYRRARDDGDPFRVVLMDLTIPGGLGGREAVGRLRGLDPGARVIVSSGYSNDPVMAEHRQWGFVDVLPKPYTVDQLAAVLARVTSDSG